MTLKQYSDIQRNLGAIEGVACAIQGNDDAVDLLFQAVQSLDAIIDEIRNKEYAAPLFVGHNSVEGEDSCQPCRFFRCEETEEPCSICCHGGGFKSDGALSYYMEADHE